MKAATAKTRASQITGREFKMPRSLKKSGCPGKDDAHAITQRLKMAPRVV